MFRQENTKNFLKKIKLNIEIYSIIELYEGYFLAF